MTETIRVSEIFGPTVQGEGTLIGLPTVFVRTGGCDFRCRWCDTIHAVDNSFRHDWTPMEAAEIMDEVERLSGGRPLMVTLSGGNPAIQPLGALIALGQEKGYSFTMETQGSIAQAWFSQLDALTLSPKPPSSGMDFDPQTLQACVKAAGERADVNLKFVVADDADYDFARDVAAAHPALHVYLQPCNPEIATIEEENPPVDMADMRARLLWLVEKTTADGWFDARVLPQLHVMIWGNEKGV